MYEGLRSLLCDSMWSLTLPRVGRTSGAKTFRSLARKDFFRQHRPKGDIGVRKSVRQRRERPKVPLRRLAKCVTVRGGQGQPEPRHTLEFR